MHCTKLLLTSMIMVGASYAQPLFIFQQGHAGYTGASDTHIFINKPNNNAGGETLLEASGNDGAADAKHALIRFDLSALPSDLQIDSAWVALYFTQTRTLSEMASGLAYYFESSQNSTARALLEKLCDGIAACQLGDAASFPFGLFLSTPNNIHLWHAWGSRQLMALAVAGKTLQRQDWINAAKKAANNFYLHLLTSEILAEVNPSLVVYSAEAGQINYGTISTVEGLIELYHTAADAASCPRGDHSCDQHAWTRGRRRASR